MLLDTSTETILREHLSFVPELLLQTDVRDALVAAVTHAQATQPLIVCDVNTHAVLGETLSQALNIKPLILPREVKPSFDVVWNLKQHAAQNDVLIAVGSGTINDICKLAAFELDKPYICCPTAPSMNGYVSANASIFVGEHKVSFKARPPVSVLADLGVLSAAPVRLIHAGLGDTLARSTAQADWLLAHLLTGSTYDATPFNLLAPYEAELLQHSGNLTQGDETSIRLLFINLLLSGFGMTMVGSSAPASQGEHMIAHTMEMVHPESLPTFHGEQIAVTAVTMAGIQETMLKQKPVLARNESYPDIIAQYFGALSTNMLAEYQQKHMHQPAYVEAINEKIDKEWDAIRDQIKVVMLPGGAIRKALENVGAPTSIHALGWNYDDYQQAITHAKYSRNRFTFLDLAA